MADYRDINIKWPGYPNYNPNQIIEDDAVNVVVQKLNMLLFTNTGENYGDPNMGCNLEFYLCQTNVPSTMIEDNIRKQITTYIPELDSMGYTLTIDMYQGSEQDQMYLNFVIAGNNIVFAVV